MSATRPPRYNRRLPQNSEPAKTLQQRFQETKTAYGNILAAFRLVWNADKSSTTMMAILTLVSAMLPAAQAWTGKLIVDSVVAALEANQNATIALQSVVPILLFEFALLVSSAIVNQLRRLAEHVLNARLSHHINQDIIRKALSLDLQYFEDPAFYDKLQNARREADFRTLGIINGSFLAVQNILTLFSFAAVLVFFNPLIALLLFGATIPSFIAQGKYSQLYFRLLTWRAPESRKMQYLEHVLTVDSSVKEVKLFGLGEPLLQRYNDMYWKIFHEDVDLARRRSWMSLFWGLVATGSYYIAYAWIIFETVSGIITLGSMTLYLTLFRQSQGTFQGLFTNINQLYENSLFISNLFQFLDLQSSMDEPANPAPMPHHFQQGIEFRNVSFRYPGRDDWALHNVSFHIAPGEKIALVGPNGAGKTTLIKLLTRLYDPTEGQILLDGVDLRSFRQEDLHDRIGVIFQDFVRYQSTVRENIGFGRIDDLENTERIQESAIRGGADTVANELPEGLETVLGRWFEKGQELSGGQWQKVALGRAFMRDGEVLVLDEPTAALDAEREYEIFQRFRELTEGKIAVLISHRFSTVRMADRIMVIENGAISEMGTHDELVQHNGTYARLFEMQASGYR